ASVALLSLAVDRSEVDHELDGTGFLVPRPEGRTVTACSWATSKWAHLGAAEGRVWLRVSVGRDGDDSALALPDEALVDAVAADLAEMMGLQGRPDEARVSRWDASLPQYRPGHLERMDAVDAELAALDPTLVVTGAALRGIGVPACIRQGRAAARLVAER
ncbi:MAG TPA: protoporphyrinogen oxidase, partial [Acidimicrobiales bacterium]